MHETSDEYKNLLERVGFRVLFSKIVSIKKKHTSEEVFNIFSSGAAIGYLGKDFYDVKADEDYRDTFRRLYKMLLSGR